jgi:endonuclease/exonuclease/phosphatase (EEP) superfamily protein YafD
VALAWAGVTALVLAVLLRQAPIDAPVPIMWIPTFLSVLLVASLPLLVLALVLHRRALAAVCALVGLAGLWIYVPEWGDGPHDPPDGWARVRVLSANLLFLTGDVDALMARIDEADPDVVVTMETTPQHRRQLRDAGLYERYPNIVTEEWEYGTVLLSRLPLEDARVLRVDGRGIPSATLVTPNGPVDLLAVHLAPPTFGNGPWKAQLARLHDVVVGLDRPLLAGDFNATSDHWSFRRLLGAGLVDGQRTGGTGLGMTWPHGHALVRTPVLRIDHVLAGEGLEVTSLEVLSNGGSDHRLLVADVAVSPPAP